MKKRMRGQRGMTLLEVLLALGLTAIIAGLGMRLLISVKQWWLQQQARTASARAGWIWVHKISKELRMAVPPDEYGAGGQWRGADAQASLLDALPDEPRTDKQQDALRAERIDEDTIRFATARLWLPDGGVGPGVVQYSLKRDEDKRVVGLERKAAPRGVSLDDVDGAPVTRYAVSLDFHYLGADGKWRDSWQDGSKMPRAVRVAVGTFNRKDPMSTKVTRFSTAVNLPTGARIAR